ncbi:MAG: tRNA 2-thiouridine(34) synthase MnmA [Candidatus Omnitrophota bacterium]
MNKKRVLVAMSGGVDSSVAAVILNEEGYEAIGATMKIWPGENCAQERDRPCCSLKDIEDARRVCDKIGIRHYVLNLEKPFREKVMDYFVKEYLRGRTPNPCVVCNEKIKFGSLLKKAEGLECDFIATGHYARIEKNGRYELRMAADKLKDQSYALFVIARGRLKNILFPIGGLTKEQVRKKARESGLPVHQKPDSQEICFVPDNDYVGFIKKHCGRGEKKGKIVDGSGKVLGYHKGYWNFTIGQRRGLGIANPMPLYVAEIRAKDNVVVVGDMEKVKKKRFLVKDVNWLRGASVPEKLEADVKIRYNHKKAQACLRGAGDSGMEVEFKEPQGAITPGQAAVFYDGEYVLGGGWIEKVYG